MSIVQNVLLYIQLYIYTLNFRDSNLLKLYFKELESRLDGL